MGQMYLFAFIFQIPFSKSEPIKISKDEISNYKWVPLSMLLDEKNFTTYTHNVFDTFSYM